jgi:hypothetical protein
MPDRTRLDGGFVRERIPFLGRALGGAPILLAAACAGEGGGAAWEARTDTIGDTISVMTTSGGLTLELVPDLRIGSLEGGDTEIFGSVSGLTVDEEGGIYVYDVQVPALRKYRADGTHEMTLGRRGSGPGEYQNSDGGLAILADGRIVLRDQGNARFVVWHADGTFDTTWPGRGGFSTSRPLHVDTAGNVYTTSIRTPSAGDRATSGSLWITTLVLYTPAGVPWDTLDVPDYGYETPTIMAQVTTAGGTNTSMNNVPFTPSFQWTLSPHGRFVTGIGDRYAVDLHRPDGKVLRIGRDVEPVPVNAEERADAEERATRGMRMTDPDWRWTGEPIPRTKPAFKTLIAARDGRIWVQRYVPAVRVPWTAEDERNARDPERPLPRRYREPIVFDVFEPEGRYVGEVRAPEGFSTHPQPVIRGDSVWAVWRDDLGVNHVVRFTASVAVVDASNGSD